MSDVQNATDNVENTDVENTTPNDLGSAVEAAFEKVVATEEAPTAEAAPKAAEAPAVAPKVDGDTRIQQGDKQIDPVSGRVLEPIKAPTSWTPTMREKWGTIDPQVQKFINDRERSIQETLSKTADERKFATQVREVFQPYDDLLKTYNVNGVDLMRDLLSAQKTLAMGSPQEKAHLIHRLIVQSQPDAQTMAALFNGQIAPVAAPAQKQVNVDEEVQRRLAERETQMAMEGINSDIERFGSQHEFFEDVRDMMGRIIEAGLVDGEDVNTLFKNAYDLACANHPEVKQIMSARQQATTAPAQTLAKPTPSVKPSLGAGQQSAKPSKKMTLDEALQEAARRHGIV